MRKTTKSPGEKIVKDIKRAIRKCLAPNCFVDPIKKMSIAWFSSQDIPLDGSRFEATLKMVEEIRALEKKRILL